MAAVQAGNIQVTPAAAPAAAAATPAATPPAVSSGIAPAEQQHTRTEALAEDDAIIAEMRAEHAAKTATPAPAADPKRGKGGRFQKAPEAAADGTDPEPAAAAEPAQASSVETQAICDAFESWDVDQLSKLTGKPKAFFEVNDAKWANFRAQQQTHRTNVKEHTANVTRLAGERAAVEAARTAAATEYGPAIRAAAAFDAGEYSQFVTLIETIVKRPYEEAQKLVIENYLAADPSTKELRKKLLAQERELAEIKSKAAAREANEAKGNEQTQAQRNAAVISQLNTEIGQHEAKKIGGYEGKIVALVRDSWDAKENTYTMSFEEAADQLVADADAEATRRGYSRTPSRPGVRPTAPAVPPRSRAVDARGADEEPWLSGDMDDDAIIESIKRDHRAGKLGK